MFLIELGVSDGKVAGNIRRKWFGKDYDRAPINVQLKGRGEYYVDLPYAASRIKFVFNEHKRAIHARASAQSKAICAFKLVRGKQGSATAVNLNRRDSSQVRPKAPAAQPVRKVAKTGYRQIKITFDRFRASTEAISAHFPETVNLAGDVDKAGNFVVKMKNSEGQTTVKGVVRGGDVALSGTLQPTADFNIQFKVTAPIADDGTTSVMLRGQRSDDTGPVGAGNFSIRLSLRFE